MTERSDLDRVLHSWFEDGATVMPNRVIDVVADRIGRQPQRRTWRLLPRRSHMRSFQLVAGLAAALLIAVAGWSLLARPASVGGPTPPPSPSPSATAIAVPYACEDQTTTCAGELTAGSHTSKYFSPALSYVVPDFWANSYDGATAYSFAPSGGEYSFGLLSQVAIPDQTPSCTAKQKPGVGNTVADWVTFLTKHPGLVADPPVAITVGGYSGFKVHVHRAASWTAMCPGSVGPAIVVVIGNGHVFWIDDQQVTYFLIDIAGQTVLIHVDSAPALATHQRDLLTAQPVIDSFRFTPASSAGSPIPSSTP